MDALILPLGLIAVAFVTLRLGVLVLSSVARLRGQKRHEQLSLELMQRRIEAVTKQRESNSLAWNGYRKFVIARKVEVAEGTCSFYLAPHDNKPLPPFKPGQYLTFRLNIPGRDKPVVRCYSLSDSPKSDYYRITVKRVMSPRDNPAMPPGLVSNYFHEQLGEGDILDVQAARGHFVLEPEKERPAVLIAGGVGITPLLSMVNQVADARSGRELLLFYGVRNGAEHAFKEDLAKITDEHANIRVVVCYSQPTKEDEAREGRDYQHGARISAELLRSYLQSTNYEFFMCGPPSMMQSMAEQLTQWGAANKDIHTEAFGPATVRKAIGAPSSPAAITPAARNVSCQVTFSRTGKQCGWTGDLENILDLAESHGVEIESGCRAGNCGTCVVAIKSGRVKYASDHGADLEEGTCLTCIAAPDGDLVLDA